MCLIGSQIAVVCSIGRGKSARGCSLFPLCSSTSTRFERTHYALYICTPILQSYSRVESNLQNRTRVEPNFQFFTRVILKFLNFYAGPGCKIEISKLQQSSLKFSRRVVSKLPNLQICNMVDSNFQREFCRYCKITAESSQFFRESFVNIAKLQQSWVKFSNFHVDHIQIFKFSRGCRVKI